MTKYLNKSYSWIIFLLCSFNLLVLSCEKNKKIALAKLYDKTTDAIKLEIEKDTLSILNLKKLRVVKKAVKKDSNIYSVAYKSLIQEANGALNEGPFSVTNKLQTPKSGNKSDYMSIGPYWWPDPDKSDGLPWVRRDGEVNPLTLGNNLDLKRKSKMFHNTYRLAFANFLSGEEKYAEKSLELLSVWFLNPETKMNPNLNYAQGIPGKTDGRGIGIIEFTGIVDIINSIELLELNKAMTSTTSKALRGWLKEYLHWLQHSENGIDERNWENNHGTWYDVQVVSLLMFFDRLDEAKAVLEEAKTIRIASQIESDGKLTRELERTRSLHYSAYNLEAFTYLAYFGKQLNVDLWNYNPPKAGGIKDAYNFLYPYIINKKEWEYPEISGIDNGIETLKELFLMAGNMFNIPEYTEIGMSMNEKDDFKILSYSF